ncbi:exodeoxyribonuclease VII small subunit XseB [Psychroflexus gondwanensis ACAM 44]|jgi:exodeoxyribonuclease VII small subunit|uniref:Exodeoxyribonuclease 7 small subunit n=1 Tax=Psychroflexus gondwanensis ACAM 44 TaxID=1189619 RepID=N1WRT5_9FLAO|nr:exodeoxyribonuclease VII small subunit [Psychroflexus gondwanensis]EMY81730.1 exodeoxyribonuclease VII small subunit XseB [Psychroflexus gondwanensis ACAM 44]
MEKIKNYETALSELKTIVSKIENDSVSVDELTKKVERASELIKYCKTVLTKTETEVNSALDDMVDLNEDSDD